ncbi:RrF2 family transcriptional regulator [Nitrosophilus labii]|uniref:RrF2 family transcriptional regulator n=1 Tax=Nitrosophilus labii TaxID=2706014 RepID=UPI001656E536|nr:Rrf2 family transcriptional regulator [Nitrosophilus labii]
MLFTRATEYALLSLILIAKRNEPMGTDMLSRQLGIPKSFLAKILQNLARQGILKSFKGATGGFMLAKSPKELSIKEIAKSAEGKNISVFDCSPAQEYCPSNKGSFCTLWPFLNKLQNKIDIFLEELTLQDLME